MAESSVTQLLPLINQQINFQETLNEYLAKAEALTHVAMSDVFLGYAGSIGYHYLWVLKDIVEKARKLNEESLNLLLKVVPQKLGK